MSKLLITTAIPYVNADPHIGFGLEAVQADVVARYRRLMEDEVYFLTGTDENSLKNVQAAKLARVPVKELVDANAEKFKKLKTVLDISYDDFIRTTEVRHVEGAKKFWRMCAKDIFRKVYRGLYCVGCELFYKESELAEGLCPEHHTKPETVEEENYFFRLSAYQKQLGAIYAEDRIRIVPERRKHEVERFIESGLEDFSISRSITRADGWGIPVPDDNHQIMYVWFEALTNYVTGIDFAQGGRTFEKFWRDEDTKIIHMIGKGVLRFHAIYWPAMLLSAGLRLPNTVFVHGYVTAEGEKMSKSLGNVIDPKDVTKEWGIDPTRYFLLREIPPCEDGDFSMERLARRYADDLAHGLGNLVSRSLTLMIKAGQVTVGKDDLKKDVLLSWKDYSAALTEFKFNTALEAVWNLMGRADRYINAQKPWQQTPGEKEFEDTASSIWLALANLNEMLQPFMPHTASVISQWLGYKNSSSPWQGGKFMIQKPGKLFPLLLRK